jgi:hypothetical protein
METIYIVSTGTGFLYVIQGIFTTRELAEKFADAFEDATINDESLYTEFPKLYRYECTMDLESGDLIEVKECKPSVSPMLLTIDGTTLLAVGETKAEAQYNAESYLKKLRKESSD